MESQGEERLLKIGEASQMLNLSPQTLRDWVDRGWIECVRLPSGHRRFRESDIKEIIYKNRNKILEKYLPIKILFVKKDDIDRVKNDEYYRLSLIERVKIEGADDDLSSIMDHTSIFLIPREIYKDFINLRVKGFIAPTPDEGGIKHTWFGYKNHIDPFIEPHIGCISVDLIDFIARLSPTRC
jgi:excisionase family DNA binding protein